ncbi:MAG: hypothetical protein ACFFA4_10165 [Promethearchaeota archaeon]
MNEIKNKIYIFGFQLNKNWTGTLFFIGLLGVLYNSKFWMNILTIISYIRVMEGLPPSIQVNYIGYIIINSFSIIFGCVLFCICLYILIRCKQSRSIEPELNNNPKLFNFYLSQSHLLGIFIVSLLVILYTFPAFISGIYDLAMFAYYSILSGEFMTIGYLLQSALYLLIYSYLFSLELCMFIICIIAARVSRRSLRNRFSIKE